MTERVYDEIASELLDFICARPDARCIAGERSCHLH
jgi:hypothetical protein